MPTINLSAVSMDSVAASYEMHSLVQPIFLNSVPKSGTHLIKNIFRMFVKPEQQFRDAFIQYPTLRGSASVFDPAAPKLSWGHLFFSDDSAAILHGVRHLVLVRDPWDWVLARARFFVSDAFVGNMDLLKTGRIDVDLIINMMIFGIHDKAPSLQEIYTHNAVSWLGRSVQLVRYEDVVRHLSAIDSDEAQAYFSGLLLHKGMQELPTNWKERVLIGSDRKYSGTSRDNLAKSTTVSIPSSLTEQQKKLIEFASPGLRNLLGYSD